MASHQSQEDQSHDHLTIPTPSYPTRCLEFLRELKDFQNPKTPQAQTETKPNASSNINDSLRPQQPQNEANTSAEPHRQSSIKLKILIAGAGLGGLGTAIALARRGHTVTVFEQAEKLSEKRSAQESKSPPTPRASSTAGAWNPTCDRTPSNLPASPSSAGNPAPVIGHTRLIPDFRDKFGAPYYVVHRAHFHDAMYKLAVSLGVEIKVGRRVVGYDLELPAVVLEGGEVVGGDLVVGSDGVKSLARATVLGDTERDVEMVKTGFAAYRATVDVGRMREDPELAWLVERQGLNIWIGHMRHVMTYTIAAGNSFNMVLSHPETSDPSTWDQSTALENMRSHFEGWDPVLTKVINMVDKTMKWPLLTGPKLSRWVAPSGKVLILGDAAHAMLPYMSQGAAMAIEDGTALATTLSYLTSKSSLPSILAVFERLRAKRCAQMQDASKLNGILWHFEDGEVQRARDRGMGGMAGGVTMEGAGDDGEVDWSANQWSDPVTQEWCYGYDAEEEVKRAFAELQKGHEDEELPEVNMT